MLSQIEFANRKEEILKVFEQKTVNDKWEKFILKFIPSYNRKIINFKEFRYMLKFTDKNNTDIYDDVLKGLFELSDIFKADVITKDEIDIIKTNLIDKIEKRNISNGEDFLLQISDLKENNFLTEKDIFEIKKKIW
ncbi:hypothetical protein KA977_12045 [Candidatus Dependentiae bacterium]|nr:hypothetical protein [Candidatus Dependentiae bacterium]